MSEIPASPVPPQSSESKSAKPARWPKWRKRLWRGFLVALTVALIVRVVLFFAIGPVMRKVAGLYGFDVSFQRQEITLLGGDVGLWYLKITPQSGGEPIFQADYIRGSISTLELIKGRLFVQRAEADGVALVVERTADGKIPVLDQVLAATASAPQPATPQASPAGEKNLDFTPPLKVEAFRLQHVRATIRDASVKPPLQATVAMDVRVSSLGEHDRPTIFDVDIWSDAILDSMRITGQATSIARSIVANATVTLRGLHPGPLAGYLAPLGIKPVASSLSADLAASLKTEALADSAAGVKAIVTLDRIHVTADERDAAILTKFQIQADKVSSSATTIGNISIEGGRLFTSRSSEGLLRAFGLELGAAPASASTKPAVAVAASPAGTAPPYALTIKQVTVVDAAVSLSDYSVSPVNELRASIPRFAIEGQAIDPSNPNSVIPIAGDLSIPGIAATARISGNVKPFAATKSLQLRFDAAGIKFDALKPYLTPLGIDSLIENGTAQGQLDATVQMTGPTIDLQLSQLKLSDGEELIGLGSAKIVGAGIDQQSGRIKVESVDISGPSIDISRDAAGRLTVAKLQWDASKMKPASSPARSAPSTASSTLDLASLPKLEIGSFTWKGMKLRLRDEQVQPTSIIAIDDAGIELRDFVFDLSSAAQSKPGTIRAWISAPELAKQGSIEGTLSPGQNAFAADLKVRSEGIQTAMLTPYLKSLGITPTILAGALQADAKLNIAQTRDGIIASVDASGISFKDSDVELGGVDSFQVKDLTLTSTGIDIKSIEIAKPRSAVALEADNAFTAMGLRVLLPQAPPARVSITTQPSTAPTPLALPSITLHQLRITDGALGWTDRGFANPVQTTGRATIDLADLTLGSKQPAPAKFKSVFSAVGVLDEMIVEGTFDPNPAALAFAARVTGRGIRAGALASYLPAGVEIATRDGQLRATIDAGLKLNPQGGSEARLAIDDVDWRDGSTAVAPLFAMQGMRVSAPRIDVPGNVIEIAEVSARGVQTDLSIGADGAIIAAGAKIGGKPTAEVPPNPSIRPPPPAPSTQPGEDVAALIADARRPLPLVTLKTLDLNLSRATLRDLSRPAAAALVAENIRVQNTAPIELAGENAAARQPVKINIDGTLTPLVERFTINATLSPFAQEPSATIDVSSNGIQGEKLTDLVPELKEYLSGASLTDGRFKTKIESHIKFDRKSPRDFDLSRGFVLDLSIDGTEFRNGAEGPILAGLDSMRLEQAKVDPRTGSVLAKSLEITKPKAMIYRDKDGLHALGLLAPLDRYLSPTTAPSTAPAAAAAPAVASAPTTKPTSEIRIDRLTLNGLDLRIEDRSVTPTFIAPLNGLDVEVRDLTTLALYEPRAIRFSAIVNADKVPLPSSGKSSTTRQSSASTQPATRPMEEREFFSQIVSTGRLSLYPKPAGYAKTSINGVELAAFEGLATLAGVQLHGGAFDGTFDLRFREDGTLDSRSKLVITDLQYAEGPNGPLGKVFKSPVDLVIAALEAADKSITVPVNVSVRSGELSGIFGAAIGAVTSIVGQAVGAVPEKAFNAATDFVGVGGLFRRKPVIPPPLVLKFAPGSTYVDSSVFPGLAALTEFARKNKNAQIKVTQELGLEDVAVADSRANLSPADALVLAGKLRQQKLTLSEQRSKLAGELRAQLVFASAAKRELTTQQLRSLDQEIGETEQAMDQVYDLLRPGADRQAARRTRAGGIEIARQRLGAVESMLKRSGSLSDFAQKVSVASPQYNPSDQHTGGQIIISIVGGGAATK